MNLGVKSLHKPKPKHYNRQTGEHARRVIRHKNKHKFEDDPDRDYIKKGLDKLDFQDQNEEDVNFDYEEKQKSQDEVEDLNSVKAESEERLEWQLMLASVLQGEVLKSEKSRMIGAMTKNENENKANYQYQLWLGLRAKLTGKSVEDEILNLEERRIAVDGILNEVLTFKASTESQPDTDRDVKDNVPSIVPHNIFTPSISSSIKQVDEILRKIEFIESLYPNNRALEEAKPVYASVDFKNKLDALCSYSTVTKTLRSTIQTIRAWTGSDEMDVTRASEDEMTLMIPPLISNSSQDSVDRSLTSNQSEQIRNDNKRRNMEPMSFIEKLLKEESFQTLFERRTLISLINVLDKAKELHINWRHVFESFNLPSFDNELIMLVRFPSKLMQEALTVRVEYALKVSDPTGLVVDQLIEDFRSALSQATQIKKKYAEYTTRIVDESTGLVKWELPQEKDDSYGKTLLKALWQFFKLILTKLKSGSKALYFKETDILEDQWNFVLQICEEIDGADIIVAERFCSLTNRLMKRITNYFETQLRTPDNKNMNDEETLFWYSTILENVRLRYRKLHRFSKRLALRFDNSAEYSLDDFDLSIFIETLVKTDHFLVYSDYLASESIYVVADKSLSSRPDIVINLLTRAFLFNDNQSEVDIFNEPEARYLLVISPRDPFFWAGSVMEIDTGPIELELQDRRIRLIADGPTNHLRKSKEQFESLWVNENNQNQFPFQVVAPEQVALPKIDRELRKISLAAYKLTVAIGNSPIMLRKKLYGIPDRQDVLSNWYSFATEHGQHAIKYMESPAHEIFKKILMNLSIDWLSFICEDCIPTDRKTFRWAVNALENAMSITQNGNILELKSSDFELLRNKVATCMTLLISHFDILGARSSFEAKKEREAKEETRKSRLLSSVVSDDDPQKSERYGQYLTDAGWIGGHDSHSSVRLLIEERMREIHAIENKRKNFEKEQRIVGRVLDTDKVGDRSLVFLANAASNVSIRWQQGKLIGAGTFGSVYLAVNLDTGGIMAVKEIRFIDVNDPGSLYKQIHDEMKVMEMLSHPNIVEYYGIEVHKEKVYIFEEFCQGGSLTTLLEHGRIEDESVIRVYAYQMLEGLGYLHSQHVVHRDIKPDNILLNYQGILKFVDFGAAKVLAKNRTMARTRINNNKDAPAGSLAGTPMYMSPEVIKGEVDTVGKFGAMDVWSLGCVILELSTGRKPWHGLDNEWAIMVCVIFHYNNY